MITRFTGKAAWRVLCIVAVAALLLASCGPTPTPTATPRPPTATSAPPTATKGPPTATPAPPAATPVPPTATKPPPTATSVPPTATPAPQPVKLTLGVWGGAAQEAVYQSLIKSFKAKYPHIDVELVTAPDFLPYLQKIQTMMAGGTAPDVMDLGQEWYSAFAAKGAFLDLTPFIQADTTFKVDDYLPIAIQTLTIGGKLYGLPHDLGLDGLYYNKKLFDKAGLKYPDNTWTWSDLLAAAQKLTIRDAASGRVTQYGWTDSGQNMWPWIWQNGGTMFDVERAPTKCTMNSPAAVQAMQFYLDLSLKHKVAPTLAELQQTPFRDLFMSGRVAVIYDTAGAQMSFAAIKDFEWGITELAQGTQRAVNMTENGWAITAFTKRPQEAWLLAKYLAGPEAIGVLTKNSKTIPALKALTGDVPKPFVDSLAYSRPFFTSPKLLEMLSIFQAEYPAAAMGAKPVQATFDSMCAKIDAVLAQK